MFVSRAHETQHDRQVAWWLLTCALVIYGMILLGGVTRLTESGLSMVEWRPIMGILPPVGEAAWNEVFDKYRQFPEYQKINQGMSLEAFKRIFMYEYLHRVLGRLIGLLFVLPLLFFALRGVLRPGLLPRLLVLLMLGACQGLLGWYMVKSGLVDRPSVSQYRLTAHLGLAVALYAAIVWQAMSLLFPRRAHFEPGQAGSRLSVDVSHGETPRILRPATVAPLLLGLIYLMILSGGLVAGTDAGFSYPTWPRMGPGLIPPGLYASDPAWLAAFEDVTTIQFNHRSFAYVLLILVGAFALRLLLSRQTRWVRAAAAAVLGALLLQIGLGISTLLSHMAVPVAAAHQAGAVLLLTTMLLCTYAVRLRPEATADSDTSSLISTPMQSPAV